jgi:hypothetical protein
MVLAGWDATSVHRTGLATVALKQNQPRAEGQGATTDVECGSCVMTWFLGKDKRRLRARQTS